MTYTAPLADMRFALREVAGLSLLAAREDPHCRRNGLATSAHSSLPSPTNMRNLPFRFLISRNGCFQQRCSELNPE